MSLASRCLLMAYALAADRGPVSLALPALIRDPMAPIPVAFSSSLPTGASFFSSSGILVFRDCGLYLKERPI